MVAGGLPDSLTGRSLPPRVRMVEPCRFTAGTNYMEEHGELKPCSLASPCKWSAKPAPGLDEPAHAFPVPAQVGYLASVDDVVVDQDTHEGLFRLGVHAGPHAHGDA